MARNKLSFYLQRGFTLVEVLVVVSLTVIVMITAAGLFFATLVGNNKKDVVVSVKEEGDYAISQMEFLLRNAVELVPDPAFPAAPICPPSSSRITFKSGDDGVTTLFNNNGRIASQSASSNTPVYLTSSTVTLSPSDPVFKCTRIATNYGTYVNISFTLSKQSPDFSAPSTVTQVFSTSVNLRSF